MLGWLRENETLEPPLSRRVKPRSQRFGRGPAEDALRKSRVGNERLESLIRRRSGTETDQLRITGNLRDRLRELTHGGRASGTDVVDPSARFLRRLQRQRKRFGDVVDVVEVPELAAVRNRGGATLREPGDEVREQA